jgi:serine/threonine-protein kinase
MPAPSDVALDLTVPLLASGVTAAVRGPAALDGNVRVRIDHFVVERKIGSGGMGAIYAARDVALDRAVAIKILPDELAREPGANERFIREAQAQARLSSPHVVQIFYIGRLPADIGSITAAMELSPGRPGSIPSGQAVGRPSAPDDARGSLYFAMELIDGESLEGPLDRSQKLDPEVARKLMIQAARGLDDAYRAGLIHRDVKPGNLLADRAGNLKIADFGLAKPRDPNLSLTKEGAIMGTPYYMAPEQAMGETLDLRADMYALGCTFYHLLSGEPPFDGPNPVAVMAKHLKADARPLREVWPAVPSPLAVIVERLMAKTPAARFAAYADLIAALEAAAPTRVEPAGFWTRAVATVLDGAVASALIGLLGWGGLFFYIAYVTVAQAYFGQTAAKYVLRIRVERPDGTRLGLGRSLARLVASMWLPAWYGIVTLSHGLEAFKASITQLAHVGAAKELLMPILISSGYLGVLYLAGLVIAAVDPQKRAAHDRLIGSRVVYRLGSHKLAMLPPAEKG